MHVPFLAQNQSKWNYKVCSDTHNRWNVTSDTLQSQTVDCATGQGTATAGGVGHNHM